MAEVVLGVVPPTPDEEQAVFSDAVESGEGRV